jgi:hypothetical protein
MLILWPGQYFISHSYKDALIVEALKGILPSRMTPVVFPPIKVNPDQVVSNPIMDAIRKCDGLIYIKGEASDKSFWVAMERDYALRLKKRVYSFDAISEKLSRDKSKPLIPRVFHAYSYPISQDVVEIDNFMKRRYFQTGNDSLEIGWTLERESLDELVENEMQKVKTLGGYVIIYWSRKVLKTKTIPIEFDLAMREYPNRVLIVQLDEMPLPDWIIDRIKPDQIINIMGDNKLSHTQKIDDLVVRLYWLIYRNTQGDM